MFAVRRAQVLEDGDGLVLGAGRVHEGARRGDHAAIMSWLKRREGNDPHSVASTNDGPGGNDDDEGGWHTFDMRGDEQQLRRSVVDRTMREFDLDADPFSGAAFDDGIDFIPPLDVSQMEHAARPNRLSVDAKLVHDERLEKDPEGFRVRREALRRASE